MKRLSIILLTTLLVLVAGYAAARYYTGQVLAQEVEQLAADLSTSEDIEIRQLTYRPGALQGELDYDLKVRLPAGHPLVDLSRLAAPGQISQWIELSGSAHVSQGPHLTADGLVLARAKQQWPGLTLTAGLRADGMLLGELQGDGFAGEMMAPDGLPVLVNLSPWQGDFRWQPEQQLLQVNASLQQLLLEQAGFQGEINQGIAELELSVAGPAVWSSRTDLRADRLELSSDVSGTRLENTRILAEVLRHDDRIDNRLEIVLGESLVEDIDWRSGELKLAFSDLDATAWMNLMEELATGLAEGQFDPVQQERLLRAGDDLLAAGPVLHVERLALALFDPDEPDDLAGTLRLHYPGGNGANMRDPTGLLEHSDIRLSLLATTGALRRISQWRAEAEARTLAAERNIVRNEEQIQRSAARMYRTTLISLQFMPLVTVADGKAETHLEMRDGSVYQHGERVMPVTQILRLLGL